MFEYQKTFAFAVNLQPVMECCDIPDKVGEMEEVKKCIQDAEAQDADAVRVQYMPTIFHQ